MAGPGRTATKGCGPIWGFLHDPRRGFRRTGYLFQIADIEIVRRNRRFPTQSRRSWAELSLAKKRRLIMAYVLLELSVCYRCKSLVCRHLPYPPGFGILIPCAPPTACPVRSPTTRTYTNSGTTASPWRSSPRNSASPAKGSARSRPQPW